MADLIRNGGFPMWFILAFGLVALGAAARFAIRPAREQLAFVRAMAASALYATLMGTAAALGATFLHVAGAEQLRGDPQWALIIVQGLGESMSPGIVGFALLTLTSLLVAVGSARVPEQAA